MLYISGFDPFKYIESALYKAEVKDVFGKITILENKLIGCTITFNNIKYTISFDWVKPASGKNIARLLIGMNFIKHRNVGIIVQEEKSFYM